jgi:hypothetical protein
MMWWTCYFLVQCTIFIQDKKFLIRTRVCK